jgi:hypothetical protein
MVRIIYLKEVFLNLRRSVKSISTHELVLDKGGMMNLCYVARDVAGPFSRMVLGRDQADRRLFGPARSHILNLWRMKSLGFRPSISTLLTTSRLVDILGRFLSGRYEGCSSQANWAWLIESHLRADKKNPIRKIRGIFRHHDLKNFLPEMLE